MRNAAAFGGSGATDLSIAQSGATQVIQSSTGTDVGVRNLYGLLITEGATDTLHFRVDSSLFATTYDLTQIPISSLKDALAANTITGNANYKQEWQWNTLAGTDGLKLSSTSTAAASDLQKLFNVTLSGTNGTSGQDTWAGYFSNTHAGTTSTNYGLYGIATNGTSANYGVYGVANGANGQGVTGTSSGNIGVLGIGAIGVYGSATSGAGVYSTATSGIAVSANATSGTGVEAIVTSGIPISVQDNSAGTNTVEPMIQMYHLTTGTAAAGIGSSIVYNTEANDGSDYVSTTLTSKWTTATAGSRVSNFVVSGVNAAVEADLLTVKGSGQIQLNKYTGGAFSGTAVYNVLIDASGNLIVGSVPVGTNNITEENNSVVQSGTLTYDFQNPFDVTTDGGTEVNISLDCGEFTTVTAIESDDYMLMHDSGTPANQKILWTDVLIDLIAFEDGNSSVGTGNTIDVGEGLDIDMSPSTEANINLDASEFQIDGTAEGTEYVLIHDADTTAGHQIQRRLVSSFSGGSDTNFGGDDLTWDANRVHDQSTYTTEIGGTNMTWKFQDNNATTGAQIILAGNVGNSDAPMGQIQFMYDDSGFATDQTAWTMVATRETDSQEHSTLEITANEAASAPPVATWEENENLSDNTQETSLRLNSGIAYTQYWESTGANAITLDRGYYNVALLTGHTGTITLPQIYGIDESNIEIDAAQVPIGQEYVITNLSGSSVTIAAYNPAAATNDDWLNGTEAGTYTLTTGSSVVLKAVTIVSNEGHWFVYD